MGYVSITAKIVSLLSTISEIEAIYDHNPNTFSALPAVTIVALGHKSRFNDTSSNILQYQYIIRVWYRLDKDDDAEGILEDLTDKILEKLEGNVVSAPEWDKALPTEAVFRTAERDIDYLVSEITASFEKRVNRNV